MLVHYLLGFISCYICLIISLVRIFFGGGGRGGDREGEEGEEMGGLKRFLDFFPSELTSYSKIENTRSMGTDLYL